MARDLQRDPKTIKRWIQLLENVYIVYRITPYHKKIARALLKEPKIYFYDHALVSDEGARLENLVANALLKECHYREDTLGVKAVLHYVRTKDGREIDFLVTQDAEPTHLVEVKSSNGEPSSNFAFFQKYFKSIKMWQLVKELKREMTLHNGLEIRHLIRCLSTLSLEH